MGDQEALLNGLIDYAMDAIVSMNDSQNIIVFNHAAEKMFGYSASDILGQSISKIVPDRFQGTNTKKISGVDIGDIHSGEGQLSTISTGVRADGSEFAFEASLSRVAIEGGLIITATLRDITERVRKEEALKLAASVYKSSHEGIFVTDANNLIIDMNPAAIELTGYSLEEVLGKNPRIFQSGKHDSQYFQDMWKSINENGFWQGEIWDKCKDGSLQARWLSISAIHSTDGKLISHVGQFSDISEKKRKDELIWSQANFDSLTNLPNRRLLADRIRHEMASSSRSKRHGALLSMDLDQFKQLNDTHGHSKGDQLLVEVARRLQGCIREEDTVSRMGGDEFMVVLSELSENQSEAAIEAGQIAEKMRLELGAPYLLDTTNYRSSVSIGIVLFYGPSVAQEVLLAHVDAAMYQAKAKGRNAICFFDSSLQATLERRIELEEALRVALPQNELRLFYQLQADSSGRLIGTEALLRWMHPSLGMVLPVDFIPIAEDSGLIIPIGDWVLETACAQLANWQNSGPQSQLSIAVNISSRQFSESNFVNKIRSLVANTGVKTSGLKLELTESIVLGNVDDCIMKMKELQEIGIKFSIDDFGTGYSSLTYLSRLPIDQIKIDQSFIRNITSDSNSAAIVQAIISLAHSLGLEVIAEGVETGTQRDFLKMRGCLAYQGYLYSKPLPIDELEIMLLNH